jgi:hypothetical protein
MTFLPLGGAGVNVLLLLLVLRVRDAPMDVMVERRLALGSNDLLGSAVIRDSDPNDDVRGLGRAVSAAVDVKLLRCCEVFLLALSGREL